MELNTKAKASYIIVTPARDEAKNIEATIESVACQTITPLRWVIVDDGSLDGTAEIAQRRAGAYPWISVLRHRDRGYRKNGGGVIEAFQFGYKKIADLRSEF